MTKKLSKPKIKNFYAGKIPKRVAKIADSIKCSVGAIILHSMIYENKKIMCAALIILFVSDLTQRLFSEVDNE